MPNVAATERVSTSPPSTGPALDLHSNPLPMPVLQLATKLCSACSRPLNVQDIQQRPVVPLVAARASTCSTCGEGSKAEADRHIGRNRANSSSAPPQPVPLPLAPLNTTALTVVLSSVSKDDGSRLQFPQQYSPRNPSQDARGLGISPYSPTRPSYFLSRVHSPTIHAGPLDLHTTTLDPLVDISRLRVRSTGIGCLNPGETFQGIQTNQGKEHEVSVTIMDVNLASSTLSGSLTIHDLTPNDPELTTYFDGEIIGSRFGFLTPEPSWGATDEGDLAHWERFGAPFRAVKGELCQPDLTLRGGERGERGVVFMRWKERFLMPNHNVTSVAGASFAGFYYICLEFSSSAHPDHEADDSATSDAGTSHSFTTHAPHLSGYYYFAEKDMCDQYQKLMLHHVPRPARACFEFR